MTRSHSPSICVTVATLSAYAFARLRVPGRDRALFALLAAYMRGAAFLVARGETISPVDPTFALLGGGPYGAIGATGSWIVGIIACVGVIGPRDHRRWERRCRPRRLDPAVPD